MIFTLLLFFVPFFVGFVVAAALPKVWPSLAVVVGLALVFVPTGIFIPTAPDSIFLFAIPILGVGLGAGGMFKLVKPFFDRLRPETVLHG